MRPNPTYFGGMDMGPLLMVTALPPQPALGLQSLWNGAGLTRPVWEGYN